MLRDLLDFGFIPLRQRKTKAQSLECESSRDMTLWGIEQAPERMLHERVQFVEIHEVEGPHHQERI